MEAEGGGGGRAAAGCLYLVDTLAGDPKVLQVDAETYYKKLLKKSSSTPDVFSISGEEVQTFGERIVLFVLNYIIFGTLEGSSANDAFFLPHSATECAKILWRNGEAVAFYSVKMKGTLCDGTTSQCYLLPVLDTIFVRRKYRRDGLGMKMLHDFCQSFMAEDALGISCPISAAMYQVCQKFLQTYPEEQKRLWEVEAPGDWSQRENIWLKIQMESPPSGKAEVHCHMENAQTSKPGQSDVDQIQGVEYFPNVGKVAGDATE
ncbi:protein FAM169B isoform X2 [Colius striatus]|uniref:protein FAM169B isoform X2 n=1 Tax=Colius striatus TaxID=57412 RepID=UPI002B1E8A7F|nr:protein FAM169B isoform X2 [Colius striatus]